MMDLNQKAQESNALSWLNAFNKKDLNALLSLYHPQALHVSPKLRSARPETNGEIQGHSALAKWWQDAFVRLPTLFYRLERLTFGINHTFIEYTRTVEGEVDLSIAELLEFEGAFIMRSRVFHG